MSGVGAAHRTCATCARGRLNEAGDRRKKSRVTEEAQWFLRADHNSFERVTECVTECACVRLR